MRRKQKLNQKEVEKQTGEKQIRRKKADYKIKQKKQTAEAA